MALVRGRALPEPPGYQLRLVCSDNRQPLVQISTSLFRCYDVMCVRLLWCVEADDDDNNDDDDGNLKVVGSYKEKEKREGSQLNAARSPRG